MNPLIIVVYSPSNMQHHVETNIKELAPGLYVNCLVVTVDRIFVRESVKQLGEPIRDVKEGEALDMICWDKEVR